MPSQPRTDLSLYWHAFPVYARNLAVLLPPLLAAVVQQLLNYAGAQLTGPLGGIGMGIFGFIGQLVFGFAFGVSLIVADDAWRHERANLGTDWDEAKRKAGNILLATVGLFFMIYVAQMIGSILGGGGSLAAGALAVLFLVYTIPAASLGGSPGPYALSSSIQIARREPGRTLLLTVVSLFVYYFIGFMLPPILAPYVSTPSFIVLQMLLPSLAIGYVALIVAKQYADIAFSRWWR